MAENLRGQMDQWLRPRQVGADHVTRVMPGEPGWRWTGLEVIDFAAGESREVETEGLEYIVLPLSGGAEVSEDGQQYRLAGRPNVFSGPSDLVYVGRDRRFTVTSAQGGRIALLAAVAAAPKPTCYLAADQVPTLIRGTGQSTRLVRNFGTPDALDADSMIACEVITPAGNWSSYPPHKHDEDRPGEESQLEEIYYFELQSSSPQGQPIAYVRTYGTTDRPIDILTEVRSGDAVLVPHGWHGPTMAPPGYDMYYLNVMAGPGEERVWLICDDPAHGWVRETWDAQPPDPRLTQH
ncbi:MAG: 5-deoxy-glucuronate isomerase [Propionicimonas sp.]